ncbi:Detected protein of unknown function [Hibiscus syriacus]|uniref:Late embryogenesis abundant protein LEA-2 subgroup domain-containing protein n=1 Tax=Hibiscus syriacus TaxID=106335 RepID=A0A6A2YY74_HIBSY|nr:late embryogenesis abundant protein At1g64065-like [Hibiscus syriacus]KAE8683872.1 Detected protein of unknown function [Hibiscus syriacus]
MVGTGKPANAFEALARAEQEEVKPFAPIAFGDRSSNKDEAFSTEPPSRKRTFLLCSGCIAVLFLILAIIVIVLSLTIFRILDPMIRLNSITIQSPEVSTKRILSTGVNLTLLTDVSVKNPNEATFKFDNGTMTVYYRGRVVGEGTRFQGKAKPGSTLRRNVTVEIDPDNFLTDPDFVIDIIGSKGLNISSYTRISGRINIMNIIKRNLLVKFNCSTTFRLSPSGEGFHGDRCKSELGF